MGEVRLRFAPSPTGALHIGGLRTALYNYLIAKKLGGKFILRIEDTDQTRYVEGAEDYIIECLKWSNLIPDEGVGFGGDFGPYRQSERTEIYHQYIKILIDRGHAYYAFDTPEDLDEMRSKFVTEENKMPKYDYMTRTSMRNSLTLSAEEVNRLMEEKTPYVIRLMVPAKEQVEINDIIRAKVAFHTEELDDKVLIKSDGLPTYHFANVVDDRLMKITHVVRGEEWLSSTAHHVLLYRYFGWEDEMPAFAHLPLILKPNGQGKLSKRDGAQFGFPVFPIDWGGKEDHFIGFREFGFLPEAVLNFLALLGWNSGTDQEIFSMKELIQEFNLDQIGKSGARFDFEKAKWFNAQYIHRSEPEYIQEKIKSLFHIKNISLSEDQINTIYTLYKDRVQLLTEFYEQARYLVLDEIKIQQDFIDKKWKPEWKNLYQTLMADLQIIEWNKESIEPVLKAFMDTNKLKMGELLPTLRVLLSGQPAGPDFYQMLLAFSKEKALNRMQNTLSKLV